VLSFRQRLAIAHLTAIVIVLTLAGFGAYWGLSRDVHGQLDAAMLALAETEQAQLPTSDDQPIVIHEVNAGHAPSFARLDRLVQIIDDSGYPLARSANLGKAALPASAEVLTALRAGHTVFQTLHGFGDEPVRMVAMPVADRGNVRGIEVAASLDDVNHVMKSAGVLFLVMSAALILAVIVVGASLTDRVFRAIDNVVRQARRIGEANLSERLPHPGTRDEIGRLVDTLNAMLERLERGFEAQRRFTADASHELRSPLSRLRTEMEVALRRPRDTPDYVETLRSCLEEVQRLTMLVDELLALARLDAGGERGPIEQVALDNVIREVAQRYEQQARERAVRILANANTSIVAQIGRGPVSLVVANLIDNAVKFSPAGGAVTVSLSESGGEAVVAITDDGPGIQQDELPRVFERFYRGRNARTAAAPGVGLGLALTQAIVRAHGGHIEVFNQPGRGASFCVHLPRAAANS
jgi:two-component system OmpR family sensor kinase